jgi:hypothetical protein
MCKEPACNNKNFSTKYSLDRHIYTKHGESDTLASDLEEPETKKPKRQKKNKLQSHCKEVLPRSPRINES